MKKSILKCFAVEDAVQDGINEFGKLSGYKIHQARPKPITNKQYFFIKETLLVALTSLLFKN